MAESSQERRNLSKVIADYEIEYASGYLSDGASAEHLESYGQLLEYLSQKGSNRQNYRHYAPRARIESILGASAFYLTDGSNWNDKYDSIHFNPLYSGYKRFGICLSANTSESIAMWMLYGGLDGNGAMINFDKGTLRSAMSEREYECGYFENGRFEVVKSLNAWDVDFQLVDVLYFDVDQSRGSVTIERVGEDRKVKMSADAFQGIQQVAKHKAWSYEAEVRLIARVNKRMLGGKASKVSAIRIPFPCDEGFVSSRVFDSPVSDAEGKYRDSELRDTVQWDLCSRCPKK